MLILASLGNTVYGQGPIRVACVGDSITYGSGYPAKLQSILGSNYTVANFGVSGSSVMSNTYKPYTNTPDFWRALNFQPDIVVIMLGTNDANLNYTNNLGTFEKSYQDIIRQFESLPGDQQIIVVDPPPILNNTLNLSDQNLVQDVIPQINQVANNLNLTTVNVYDTMTNHTDLIGDGVHPSMEGGEIIANQIGQAITQYDGQDNFMPGYPYGITP